jgi:serine/threonine protein kinase
MATVYCARDTRLKKGVAVKFIRRETFSEEVLERMLARFEREAVPLARLTHANIIQVTDYDRFEDTPYLVMPFTPGAHCARSSSASARRAKRCRSWRPRACWSRSPAPWIMLTSASCCTATSSQATSSSPNRVTHC